MYLAARSQTYEYVTFFFNNSVRSGSTDLHPLHDRFVDKKSVHLSCAVGVACSKLK
jgi:hypothetical protein